MKNPSRHQLGLDDLAAVTGGTPAQQQGMGGQVPGRTAVDGHGDGMMQGTGLADYLDGRGGNDILLGGEGGDTLRGSEGQDYLEGGGGQDSLDGGEGNDALHGGDGDDLALGGAGDDLLTGSRGADELRGGDGHDRLIGGAGKDTMLGGAGNDTLDTAAEPLIGGPAGVDIIDGGEGDDEIVFRVSNLVVGDGFQMVRNADSAFIQGGSGTDTLRLLGGDPEAMRQSLLSNLREEGVAHRLEADGSITILDVTAIADLSIQASGTSQFVSFIGVERVVFG